MKVLYGVQGTGNGHITRARGMVKHLAEAGIDADFIFSGRPRSQFNDMEPFGEWRLYEGMTFSVANGKVQMFDTLKKLKARQFIKDIKSLDLSNYDLIISDFEPVSAWAAKLQKKTCFGLGHQYAFDFPIPKTGDNVVTRSIMKLFAPTTESIGMHWYHFDQPIIPPIVDVADEEAEVVDNLILVYLPFESPEHIIPLLKAIPEYTFHYYHHFPQQRAEDNIVFNPISRTGFQNDLLRCNGVISNAGFELASEAIGLGKRILAKPLHGQMEQLSNALALEKLQLGLSTNKLSTDVIKHFLQTIKGHQVNYPNVPKHLSEWIAKGNWSTKQDLIKSLWDSTDAGGLHTFKPYAA